MQEYRRQIAYLYAYEHGRQVKNTGFVKAEVRGDRCRLGIYLKSFCHSGEKPGKAYIYFYHGKQTIGIYLGDLKEQDGVLQWQGVLDPENILDKGIRFPDTGGIWIRQAGTQDYIAEWEDEPVDVGRFILYPKGGKKCISCPRLGNCRGSVEHASDRRGKIYEGGHPAGA